MRFNHWIKSVFIFVTSLILIINWAFFSLINVQAAEETSEELSIVTTFYPVYEFTKEIAGDQANITLMLSGSESPHSYEPSAADIMTINNADVLVYSSEEMEYWIETVLDNIDNPDLLIVRTADGVDNAHGHHEEHHHEHSHDDDVSSEIEVSGVEDHFHTGDSIELVAQPSETTNFDHWHWFSRPNADTEWEVIEGQTSSSLEYTAPEESIEVKAVLYDDDHNTFAESSPVEITVDNHDHSHEHDSDEEHHEHSHNQVNLIGLAGHYHTGDIATLQAESNEDVSNWEWRVRIFGGEWQTLEGESSNLLEYELGEQNIEIQAVALDDEGQPIAESDPVIALVDNHDELDPHIWLDPVLAQDQVNVIRDALIEANPSAEEEYTANAEQFNQELQSLHEEFEAAFADAENRSFIVQHEAFGYLAQRYDLEQIAVGGLSTEVEPSPARIAEITELINESDASIIYYQQGADSSIAQTVANETGIDIAVLHDLEILSQELQENDLGYIEAMQENLEALKLSIN